MVIGRVGNSKPIYGRKSLKSERKGDVPTVSKIWLKGDH